MKPNRKVQANQAPAKVISLEAYRRARGATEPALPERDSVMDAYCRWLALTSAVWAFWW
jgi:hypothetical protein